MLRNPRHVIAVHDLQRTAAFYRDVLGFEVIAIPDPGWLFFVRDECFIMAGQCVEALPAAALGDHSYFAYLEVDDIEHFYESVGSHQVEVVKPLTREPWGMHGFGIRTVDGHRIMFAAPLATV